MTDTSPTTPPPAAPTIAQRAPRWIAYVVVGLTVWYAVANGLDGAADAVVYLILAVFLAAVLLTALPDTLPAGLKFALCSGGGLVGMTIIWAMYQFNPEVSRYGMLFVPLLIAAVARTLAARWLGKRKRC